MVGSAFAYQCPPLFTFLVAVTYEYDATGKSLTDGSSTDVEEICAKLAHLGTRQTTRIDFFPFEGGRLKRVYRGKIMRQQKT